MNLTGKAILIPLLTGECGYDDPTIKMMAIYA
jgi:hypothetical protein